jgi:hypothetical protein
MCSRTSDKAREIAVRYELSDFQTGNKRPNLLLKRRSFEVQRKIETPKAPAEICAHLPCRLAKQWIGHAALWCATACKFCRPNAVAVASNDKHHTERRLNRRACNVHTLPFRAPPGTIPRMDKNTPIPKEEHEEIRKEAQEAEEGDEQLDDYDKEVADSFPASDPPAQP